MARAFSNHNEPFCRRGILPMGEWRSTTIAVMVLALTATDAAAARRCVNQVAPASRSVSQIPRTSMPTMAMLQKQFQRIAFHNEFGGKHRINRIVKWNQPIRAKISGRNAALHRRSVEGMLLQLRRLSGLDIRLSSWYSLGRANLEINFTGNGSNASVPGGAPCVTYVDDRNFQITRVRIYIDETNPAVREHCIVEELTQALGLANDSNLVCPSIFNDETRQPGLYPWDRIMVQALYDRRIYPGMTLAEARPAILKIMSELVAKMSGTTHSPVR